MHTITTRSLRPEEQQLIRLRAKPDFASYGCLIVFLGILPAFLLGALGRWLGGLISADAAGYGQWLGCLAAAIILAVALVSFVPYERRRRQRAVRDQEVQLVEEIRVVEPRVVEVGLISDNEPILAFDIGDGKILYLQGQWLRDERTYGAPAVEGDPDEEFINGLPAPYSFPSSEFTVSRLPHSGEVLGIRIAGKYVAPQAVVEVLKPEYEFGDSELFDGALEDIAGVLAREHERQRSQITNG
jgi:hypothetical protein